MELVKARGGKKWNHFLERCPYAHPTQTLEFAKLLKSVGHKPIFLALENDGIRKGQILIFEQSFQGSRLIEELSRHWVSYSPPAIKKIKNSETYELFIKGIKNLARNDEIDYVVIWGYPLHNPYELMTKNGFVPIERENVVVSLDGSLQDIKNKLGRDIKRNIKKGLNYGLEIEEAETWNDVTEFLHIYSSKMARFRIRSKSKRFFRILFKEIIKKNKGKMVIAKKDEETIAGNVVIFCKDYALSLIECTKDSCYKYCPQHVIKWFLIKKMKSLGIRYFDLNFIWGPQGDQKNLNIRNFKKRWGKTIKFHEFCCYVEKEKDIETNIIEKEKITKILKQSPAGSLSDIASKCNLSSEEAKKALRELWALGVLPGQPKVDKKIPYLLEQNKDIWEIARETNRAPRYILRFKYYLKNININVGD